METHAVGGIVLTDRYFNVPLDYSSGLSSTIKIFARHAIASAHLPSRNTLPYLLYLQGGPGFESPRPLSSSGWLKTALESFQVLLLDQRGTGLSSPVNQHTLGPLDSDEEKANFLTLFRADSIVRDCEEIRKVVLEEALTQKWSLLGQSYGGFCAVHYLSAFPESLASVFLTGGLPPLVDQPDEVYTKLCARIITQNNRYYARYPEDVARAQKIVNYLQTHDVKLPNGGKLTVKRFQLLGLSTLGSGSGFERLHYLLVEAFETPFQLHHQHKKRKLEDAAVVKSLGNKFLSAAQGMLGFDTNPIYALLHEAIYCQHQASNWSAQRMVETFPAFKVANNQPVMFFGELMYQDMFDDFVQLRPLKECANILASFQNWPRLYNIEKLRQNQVPVVAAVYYDDIYVDFQLSEDATRTIGSMKVWITNEYPHSGLHDDGGRVFSKLQSLLAGE